MTAKGRKQNLNGDEQDAVYARQIVHTKRKTLKKIKRRVNKKPRQKKAQRELLAEEHEAVTAFLDGGFGNGVDVSGLVELFESGGTYRAPPDKRQAWLRNVRSLDVSWNDEAICKVCERQMDDDEIIPLDIGGVAHGRCYANVMIYFYPWGVEGRLASRMEQLMRTLPRKGVAAEIGGLKSR